MIARRIAIFLLVAYLPLSAIQLGRTILGLDFLLWPAFLLPLIGFSFAAVHAAQSLGWRWAALFIGLTFTVSLLFESLGVVTGWVYGPYYYTNRLGPLFLGLVPYMIPMTWFMMIYPSDVIAERILPSHWDVRTRWLGVAALGGVIMTAWDLVLDPLMAARRHWVWETQGAYFGIPVQNFLGWWLTSFTILALFNGLFFRRPLQGINQDGDFERLAVLSYTIIGLGEIAEAWLAGLSGPALVGFFAMLPWMLTGWWERKSQV